ncbi:MAG: hypothetical protein HUU34_12670 [Saprospiraceae bacterium]|nr:hypothetical protein [Saprospiraceae bacterium]
MKTLRAFTLVGASLLLSFSLISQNSPGRGAWLIDGSGLISHNLDGTNRNFFASPYIKGGYFFSDRLVLGLEAFTYYSYTNDLIYNSYVDLRPFARYYFGSKEHYWRPFAYASPGWQHGFFRYQSQKARGDSYSADIGGGVAFFLAPGLALEGTLGYVGEYGEFKPNQDVLLQLGIQAFLQRRSEEDRQVAPLLEKGAMQIGLSGGGGWLNIGVYDDWYFEIRPSVAYFVINNLAVGGALTLAIAENNQIIEPEPFVRYYFGAGNGRLRPLVEAGGGFRFQLQAEKPNKLNINLKAGAGLAWFVRHNIAIEGLFYYSKFRLEDENVNNNDFLDFVIGFQYFLQSGK